MTDEEMKAEDNVAQPSYPVLDFQSDMSEPLQLQQDCEGLWSPTIKYNQQSSPTHTYTDVQTDTQDTVEEALEIPRKQHQLFPSLSPETRLTSPDQGAVAIKQEVVIVEDEEDEEEEEMPTQEEYRVRPELNVRLNYITQKAPGQQVMKRLGFQARPGTLLHPSHPPIRKHSRITSAGSSNPTSQGIVTSQHRTSNPASKPPALPLLPPPQRAPPADKRLGLSTPNRTSNNPWVNIKTHHLNLQGGSQPHQHPHPGMDPLHCGQCGKAFLHPSSLRAHLQTHSGERPFSCSMCGRRFTKLSNLKTHRRVHTGERPYSCSICGLTFKRSDHLKLHKRKHGPDL